ncbi:rhomboid family intramembrane serine protease [Fluviicola sp.]|uniref:rhomboid family intramembrane serine protease n=1 Tax=Fluviicola sp. TaxID=1917219 RepID=UPI0026096FB0|nr:rhomboid family intramembrane serine protease [Fluviicola sp.]
MFLLTLFFEYQGHGVDLGSLLGAHYFGTPLFQPYQLVTHFFMHGGFLHIFMNMYILVMFGSFLERLWGAKRYFILYVAAALGSVLLYNFVGYIQILEYKNIIGSNEIMAGVNGLIRERSYSLETINEIRQYVFEHGATSMNQLDAITEYTIKSYTPMVGASGAIFGLLAAFAILFPNTELMLIFPPIPLKAKWLIGGYFLLEVYSSFQNNVGDNVAHLAHVGGAIVGAIMVLIWRKKGKNFY